MTAQPTNEGTHTQLRTRAAAGLLPAVLPMVFAAFAVRSLLLGTSLAYYRQDWGWPATPEQLWLSFWRNLGAWDSTGVGAPNHQPMLHPVFIVWHVLALLIPAWTVGAVTIFMCLWLYGFGVAECSRRLFGAQPALAGWLGACAVLGAPLFNKIVAGHIYYLIAIAAYAWAVRFAFAGEGKLRPNAFAAAACAALCALQIQIFVAAAVTLAVASLRAGRRESVWGVVAVCSSGTLLIPEVLTLFQPSVVRSLRGLQTTIFWQFNNSAHPLDAAIGTGYAPAYYTHALAVIHASVPVRAVLWALLGCALLGAFLRRRDRVAVSLLVLGAIAFCLVAGLYGPLAFPLAYAYTHMLWASAFRELYHFAGIEWTLMCVLAAAALARLTPRLGVAFPACAALLLTLPWWPWDFAGQLQAQSLSPYAASALSAEGKRAGSDRFLLLPSEWPIAPRGSVHGGEDPFAYAVGNHPTANTYTLQGVLEAAAAYTESGSPLAARWRAVAGIGEVVSRSDVTPNLLGRFPPLARTPRYVDRLMHARRLSFADATYGKPTCLLCSYDALPVVRNSARAAPGDAFIVLSDSGIRSSTDPSLAPSRDLRIPQPSRSNADPSQAWVSAQIWSWLDPRIALQEGGVLTWSGAPLRAPVVSGRRTLARVLLLHGSIMAGNVKIDVPLGHAAWVELPEGARSLRVRRGLAELDRFALLRRYRPVRGLPSRFEFDRRLSFNWIAERGGGTISAGARYVVLKQAYSPDWRLSLAEGRVLRHFVASGYANGWEVSAPSATQVSVYYRRGRTIRVLLVVSLALWCGSVIAAFVKK